MSCQGSISVLIFGQCTPERKEEKLSRATLIALTLLTFVTAVFASQYVAPEHHKFHTWYKQIQVELNISNCCDELNNDCGPIGHNYVDRLQRHKSSDGRWCVVYRKDNKKVLR